MLARVRLSVVIPAYNEAGSLPKTIRSATAAIRRSVHFARTPRSSSPTTARRTDRAKRRSLPQDGVPVRIERLAGEQRPICRPPRRTRGRGRRVRALPRRRRHLERDGLRFVRDELEARAPTSGTRTRSWTPTGNPSAFSGAWSARSRSPTTSATRVRPRSTRRRSTASRRARRASSHRANSCAKRPSVPLALLRYAECERRHADHPRTVAERRPINISPSFACTYTPRERARRVRSPRDAPRRRLPRRARSPKSRFFPVVRRLLPAQRRGGCRGDAAGAGAAPRGGSGRGGRGRATATRRRGGDALLRGAHSGLRRRPRSRDVEGPRARCARPAGGRRDLRRSTARRAS